MIIDRISGKLNYWDFGNYNARTPDNLMDNLMTAHASWHKHCSLTHFVTLRADTDTPTVNRTGPNTPNCRAKDATDVLLYIYFLK